MVEQADTCKCHGNSIFVTSIDNVIIAYGTSGLCNVLPPAFMCAFYVVAKWKKSVRPQWNSFHCIRIRVFLHASVLPGFSVKNCCQTPSANTSSWSSLIYTSIVLSRSARRIFFYPWQVHYFRVLAQIPDVSLVACQSGAMDTALLSGTDTDSLTVFHITYRITLCIF